MPSRPSRPRCCENSAPTPWTPTRGKSSFSLSMSASPFFLSVTVPPSLVSPSTVLPCLPPIGFSLLLLFLLLSPLPSSCPRPSSFYPRTHSAPPTYVYPPHFDARHRDRDPRDRSLSPTDLNASDLDSSDKESVSSGFSNDSAARPLLSPFLPGQNTMPASGVPRYPQYATVEELIKEHAQAEQRGDDVARNKLVDVITQVIIEFQDQYYPSPSRTRAAMMAELAPIAGCVDYNITHTLWNSVLHVIEQFTTSVPLDFVTGLSKMLGLYVVSLDINLNPAANPKKKAQKPSNFALPPDPLADALPTRLQLANEILVHLVHSLWSKETSPANKIKSMWSISILLDGLAVSDTVLHAFGDTLQKIQYTCNELEHHDSIEAQYISSYVMKTLERVHKKKAPFPQRLSTLRKSLLVVEIFGGITSVVLAHGADLGSLLKVGRNLRDLFNTFADPASLITSAKADIALIAPVAGLASLTGILMKLYEEDKERKDWYPAARAISDVILALNTPTCQNISEDQKELKNLQACIEQGLRAASKWQYYYAVVKALSTVEEGLVRFPPDVKIVVHTWMLELVKTICANEREYLKQDNSKRRAVTKLYHDLQTQLSQPHRYPHLQGHGSSSPQTSPGSPEPGALLSPSAQGDERGSATAAVNSTALGFLLPRARRRASREDFIVDFNIRRRFENYAKDSLFAEERKYLIASKCSEILGHSKTFSRGLHANPANLPEPNAAVAAAAAAAPAAGADLHGKDDGPQVCDLMDRALAFLQTKQPHSRTGTGTSSGNHTTLLVQGSAGSGKSMFLRCLEVELWKQYNYNEAIPLYVSLSSMSNPMRGIIDESLMQCGCTVEDIDLLKQSNRRFVFLLDGFDEIKVGLKNILISNRLAEQWSCQVVITSRSELLIDREYFNIFCCKHDQEAGALVDLKILPFGEPQIRQYLENLKKEMKRKDPKASTSDLDKLSECLDTIEGLKDLLSNPFLLSMAQYLRMQNSDEDDADDSGQNESSQLRTKSQRYAMYTPSSRGISSIAGADQLMRTRTLTVSGREGETEKLALVTRLHLYEYFTDGWYQEKERRLQDNHDIKVPPDFQIRQSFRLYCRDLAYSLFLANRTLVEMRPANYEMGCFEEEERQAETWSRFFPTYTTKDDRALHTYLAKLGAPLRTDNRHVGFLHRSLMEYFVADLFISELLNVVFSNTESLASSLTVWNRKLLNSEPAIIKFLVDKAKINKEFRTKLFTLIESTRSAQMKIGIAGANAMTILNYMRVMFRDLPLNLRGISVPGANLSYALLAEVDLSGANLTGANLTGALLFKANLTDTKLDDVIVERQATYVGKCERSFDTCVDPTNEEIAVADGAYVRILFPGSLELKLSLLCDPDNLSVTVRRMRFSPEAQYLAIGDDRGRVFVCNLSKISSQWQAQEQNESANLPNTGASDRLVDMHAIRACVVFQHESRKPITGMDFSPDGALLFTSCEESPEVLVWSVADADGSGDFGMSSLYVPDEEPFFRLKAGSEKASTIRDIAVSPKRDTCIVALGTEDGVVWLRTLISMNQEAPKFSNEQLTDSEEKPRTYGTAILALDFNETGDLLAAADEDHRVRIWDMKSKSRKMKPLAGHENKVCEVQFGKSGRVLASGDIDGNIYCWNLLTGTLFGPPMRGHRDSCCGLAFSKDDSVLVSSSRDGLSCFWDLSHTDFDTVPRFGHRRLVTAIVFDETEEERRMLTSNMDMTCYLWRVARNPITKKWDATQTVSFDVGHKPPLGCGFTPNGIVIWTEVKARFFTAEEVQGAFGQVSQGVASHRLKCADTNVFDVAALSTRRSVRHSLEARIVCGACCRLTSKVALATTSDLEHRGGAKLLLWDYHAEASRDRLQYFESPLAEDLDVKYVAVAFNSNGKLLAASGEKMVWLFDVQTLKKIGSADLTKQENETSKELSDGKKKFGLMSVVFSPDSAYVAVGGEGRHIYLLTVDPTVKQETSRANALRLHGERMNADCPITSISFTEDSLYLAVCGRDDPTVQIWEVATQKTATESLYLKDPENPKKTDAEVWTTDTRVVAFLPPKSAVLNDRSTRGASKVSLTNQLSWESLAKWKRGGESVLPTSRRDSSPSVGKDPYIDLLLAVGDSDGGVGLWSVSNKMVDNKRKFVMQLASLPSHAGMSLGTYGLKTRGAKLGESTGLLLTTTFAATRIRAVARSGEQLELEKKAGHLANA